MGTAKAPPGPNIYEIVAAHHREHRVLRDQWERLGQTKWAEDYDELIRQFEAGEPVVVSYFAVSGALFEIGDAEAARAVDDALIGAWIVEPDGNYRPVKGRTDA